jgi:hypothetical protein
LQDARRLDLRPEPVGLATNDEVVDGGFDAGLKGGNVRDLDGRNVGGGVGV